MASSNFLLVTLCLVVFYFGSACCTLPKPNIIKIMVDDLGFNDVDWRANTDIKTPNLNDLATGVHGVDLQFYYTAPTCGPSRTQFLSGKYTHNLGLQDGNVPKCTNEELNETLSTVADKLKSYGYKTHIVGKWHAGFRTADHIPTGRGFDTFRGFLLSHSVDHYTRKSRNTNINSNRIRSYQDYHDVDVAAGIKNDDYKADDGKYSTTAFTDRALELINSHPVDDPMFLYLAYQAPHTPTETECDYTTGVCVDPHKSILSNIYTGSDMRGKFASMVYSLDTAVKQVVDALKNRTYSDGTSMYDNSYIVFTSDNGGSNVDGASTAPLKGGKGNYFEGGIRSVGFVHSPLMTVPADTARTDLIHITDWMPTFMHIASGSTVDGQALGIDGLDQFNTITTGAASSRTKIIHEIRRKQKTGSAFDTDIAASMVMVNPADGKKYKILTGRQANTINFPNPTDGYVAYEAERNNPSPATGQVTGPFVYCLDDNPEEDDNNNIYTTSSFTTDLLTELYTENSSAASPIVTVDYYTECDPVNTVNSRVWLDYCSISANSC